MFLLDRLLLLYKYRCLIEMFGRVTAQLNHMTGDPEHVFNRQVPPVGQ